MKLTMHQVQRSASPHANWASRHPPVKGGFDIWVANRQHRVPPFPWERSARTPAPQGQGCGMVASCRSLFEFQVLLCGMLQARHDSCTYGESTERQWGKGIRDPLHKYPPGKQTARRIYRVWALGSDCACNLFEQLFKAQLFEGEGSSYVVEPPTCQSGVGVANAWV